MLRKAEWMLSLVVTGLALSLCLLFMLQAGALWRDEAGTVEMATLPTIPDICRNLEHEAFPLLWPLVLRSWVGLFGSGDGALRAMGLCVGVGIVAALWLNARRLGYGLPLVALVLLGLNGAVVCHGNAVRGYGLGMLLGLLAFGSIWQVAQNPSRWCIAQAMLLALLSVHTLFYNSVFLLAACLGGVAVALRHRQWRTVGLVLGIGVVAAISMLPYSLAIRRAHDWNPILQYPINLGRIWFKFSLAAQWTAAFTRWVWVALAVGAVGLATTAWFCPMRLRLSERQRDVAVFCGAALVGGVPAYVLFLLYLSYPMQPWYFLALLAMAAACLDGCLSILTNWRWGSTARLVLVALLAGIVFVPLLGQVRQRKTDMDLLGARLQQEAVVGDLILVNPWYYGISFQRYYHGPVQWVTVPPVGSPSFHRYDLLKPQMLLPNAAIAPLLEQVAQTLRHGKRVWLVGEVMLPPQGQTPAPIPPAPQGPTGWHDEFYYLAWTRHLGFALQSHAEKLTRIPLDLGQPVSGYEDVPLCVVEGWRQPAGG